MQHGQKTSVYVSDDFLRQFALVEEIELFWEEIYAETEGAKNA